jgi:hypothetical protein
MATVHLPERVYFVPRWEALAGSYPLAEPVLLVDPQGAHRYVGVRQLHVCESPLRPEVTPRPAEALPVFEINWREAAAFEYLPLALIAEDGRCAAMPAESPRVLVTV